jgi:hypothetical protein
MSSHNLEIDYGSFLHEEKLKSDRSIFPDWYQRLRDILNGNDLLYTIQESLGEAPKYDANVDDYDEYRDNHDKAVVV